MYVRMDLTLYYISLFLLWVVPVCDVADSDADTIVGIVEGTDIAYADIQVTVEAALLRYRVSYGQNASTDAEMLKVEQIRGQREVAEFAERIREIVFAQQVGRFAIEVSEREVRERWDRLTRGMDFDEAAKRQRQMVAPLLSALKAVYEQGEDEGMVYRERLQQSMTTREWAIHLSYYRTPQRRAILEDAIGKTGKDWERAVPGIRHVLLQEELNEAIERELARTDPEFAEYIRLAATDPGDKKVQSKGPNYKAAKRHEWWQQRYREAQIEIKDDRFKDALKHLYQ